MNATNGPPHYGKALRREWMLDGEYNTVNHGSFGATPRRVLAAQDEWRRQARAPAQPFHAQGAARRVAARGGAARGFHRRQRRQSRLRRERDGGLQRRPALAPAAARRRDRHAVPRLWRGRQHRALCGCSGPARSSSRRRCPSRASPPTTSSTRLAAALTPRTRLAVLDHITSPSALVLPIGAHDRGVPCARRAGSGRWRARAGPGRCSMSRRSVPTGMSAIATNG